LKSDPEKRACGWQVGYIHRCRCLSGQPPG
jgi:hypothetical protein